MRTRQKQRDEFYIEGIIRLGPYGQRVDKLDCIGLSQAFDILKKKYQIKRK